MVAHYERDYDVTMTTTKT